MNRHALIKAIKQLALDVGIASGMTVITFLYFFIVIVEGSGFILLLLDIILTIFDWFCVYWGWDYLKTLTKDNI